VLRCLHPPGGALALLAVLTHNRELQFALTPVMVDSVLLVLLGALYNTLTGRRYPARARPPASRFSAADLDAAMKHYNQVLDVSREDLQDLLHHAEAAAYQRTLGELRCAEVMSRPPIAISAQASIEDARALIEAHAIKALPVIDAGGALIGIITVTDLARHAAQKTAAIKTVMTTAVRSATTTQPLIELLPLFAERGHHHLPVVDEAGRLAGILTQTDLVRALCRAVQPNAA
jgi:CBS domain-containing membrane protein